MDFAVEDDDGKPIGVSAISVGNASVIGHYFTVGQENSTDYLSLHLFPSV